MENCWNLSILFDDEESWKHALEGLPERVRQMHGDISKYRSGGMEKGEFLEGLLTQLEDMVRISAHAEIWLSRMITLHPVDPYYAKLSDHLDLQEAGELPLMKEIQRILCEIPDWEQIMEGKEKLRELIPYCRHLCRRIIPLETLDSESGGGWYRLRALLDHASVLWQDETVTFRELLEENGFAEWGEEMHSCVYELFCSFYRAYGDAAADILLDVLKRDEEDYRREGADSLTVYLCDYGFSEEALNAMIRAVEAGLPAWHACKRKLDLWHESIEREQAVVFEENDAEDCEESEEPCLELSDEEIDAQNEAAYHTLKDTILEQFREFHPEFSTMVEEAFAGKWVWINDDPLAYRDQHASMIPEIGMSYISLSSDCYLPAAAHELGHAWHNRCLKDQNVLYNQNELLMELPSNLAALWSYRFNIEHRGDLIEQLAASGVSEEMLAYYQRIADSPAVYEEMLSETVANIYDGYSAFCFERELRSCILNRTLTADDISEMYLKYRRRLLAPECRHWKLDPFRWIERGSLFSCRSYYNLPYMVSMLLAYRLLTDYDNCRDEESRHVFWQRLTQFLIRMNKEETELLLSEFFGADMKSTDFWMTCMKSVEVYFEKAVQNVTAV